jgi:hypothetical protein
MLLGLLLLGAIVMMLELGEIVMILEGGTVVVAFVIALNG